MLWMNRKELDALSAHHRLSAQGVEALLDLAAARPSPAEQARFGVRMLILAGVLSLAAGVVFFVAANWDALRVVGRFVLLEAMFVAAIAAALWKAPPHPVGRYALLGAFILAGALFALFGQTYQTGADVYELFLNWALLGLPLAFAARWSVLWAAWGLVLNVALALFCGWRPQGGLLWVVFGGLDVAQSLLVMVPAGINLALWGLCEATRRTSFNAAFSQQAPAWLRRLIIACAIGFGTWAGSIAILDDVVRSDLEDRSVETLLLHAVLLSVIGFHAVRRRVDAFPLAAIAASVILLGTFAIGQFSPTKEMGTFFILAVWLVVSSTLCGRILLGVSRAWRAEEKTA
jgi:hypothetical protein